MVDKRKDNHFHQQERFSNEEKARIVELFEVNPGLSLEKQRKTKELIQTSIALRLSLIFSIILI